MKEESSSGYWIVLGGGNGSTNLGDDAMWLAAVATLRQIDPEMLIITDGVEEWTPPIKNIAVLPFLHQCLRRGSFIPRSLLRFPPISLLERIISRPGRNSFAAKRAARISCRPAGKVPEVWFETVRDAAGIIVAGSGSINDDYAAHGVHGWSVFTEWAARLGKPVAIVGQGLGPLKLESNRTVVRDMIENINLLTVRDSESFDLAIELGAAPTPGVLAQDWAFLCMPEEEHRLRARQIVEQFIGSSAFIAVSFHRRHTTTKEDMSKLASYFEAIARSAKHHGYKVLCVPTMSGDFHSDDPQTAQRLKRTLDEDLQQIVSIAPAQSDPRIAQAVIGLSRGLLATRYHAMVFAIAEGVACVGLAYDPYYVQKLEGVSRFFGLEDNVLKFGDTQTAGFDFVDFIALNRPSNNGVEQLEEIRRPLRDFIISNVNK